MLSSCTVEIASEYRDSYSVLDADKDKGVVVSKRAEKGLYTSPAYFAEVLLFEGKANAEATTSETRLFSRQMNQINLVWEISG